MCANVRTPVRCGCSDPLCPCHRGKAACGADATTVVVRVDMEDGRGTPVCRGCADDCLYAGIYIERPKLLGRHREGRVA